MQVYDYEMTRIEERAVYDGPGKKNPKLITRTFQPDENGGKWDVKTYKSSDGWNGDDFVLSGGAPSKQYRTLRQSRFFITYSLHRPMRGPNQMKVVLQSMANAIYIILGEDQYLAKILVFGKKLNKQKKSFQHIDATKKADAMVNFYGNSFGNSYVSDTYRSHIHSVDLDAGVEKGPNRHHPHFHAILTVNHWSYVEVDYFIMRGLFEVAFKGMYEFEDKETALVDENFGAFYADAETPWIDIKVWPEDRWQEKLRAYVRKDLVPSQVEAQANRANMYDQWKRDNPRQVGSPQTDPQ